MVARYFDCFPKIQYNSYNCIDITRREKILDSVADNPMVFYPIDLQDGQRPDIIADKYYNDSYYSWLVWLANGVIDPVTGWHMDSDDFYNFVIANYGTIEYTQRKIMKWRTNWNSDFSVISPSSYSALGVGQQSYWAANYDVNFNVLNYSRSNTNIDVNTNMIVTLNLDPTSNTIPGVGDLVSFVLANNMVGSAEVITSNTTNIVVNNVQGNWNRLVQYSTNTSNTFNVNDTVTFTTSANTTLAASVVSSNSSTLIITYEGTQLNDTSITFNNQTSNTSTVGTNAQYVQLRSDFSNVASNGAVVSFSYATLLSQVIPADQIVYYEAAYVYDLLDEENAEKQAVHLLDAVYAFTAYNNLMNMDS